MKISKKTAVIAGFALGTLLVATTAFADMATKSGYDQLKDALKLTAQDCSSKFNSFTLEISTVVKDNGKILESNDQVEKIDLKTGAREDNSSRERAGEGITTSYNYSDNNKVIGHGSNDERYYVTEFTQPRKSEAFSNPFEANSAEDIEKIADALVGSLKDYVLVTENADGTKQLNGALTEVQIPSLVNAFASLELKKEFNFPNSQMPQLTRDIYVKEVKGSALINRDGVLENILGTAVLSGKDAQGQVHEMTIEMLAKLSGIGATTVAQPDLTGKTVIKSTAQPAGMPKMTDPEKFIGQYKNDIIVEKNGKFLKAGERIIDITKIDQQTVTGRYHDEYKPEFNDYAANKLDFDFKAQFNQDKDPFSAQFVESGKNIHFNMHFDDRLGKIFLGFNGPMPNNFDSVFNIVAQ